MPFTTSYLQQAPLREEEVALVLLVVEVEAGGLHQREAVEHHQVEGAGEEEVEVAVCGRVPAH